MTPAPVSVDWSQHLSEEGSLRQLASLRVLLSTFSGIPGVVGLHGGLPAADAFPFTEMSFTLRDGSKVVVNDPVQASSCVPPRLAGRPDKASHFSRQAYSGHLDGGIWVWAAAWQGSAAWAR